MAGADLEKLLGGIEGIYADLGEPGRGGEALVLLEPEDGGPRLDPDAETQIAAVLGTLRRIGARARHASAPPVASPDVSRAAIGGAALLMRSDFLVGRGEKVPARLPAFTYLTTLIFLGQDEAARRSHEVQALIEAEGFAAD